MLKEWNPRRLNFNARLWVFLCQVIPGWTLRGSALPTEKVSIILYLEKIKNPIKYFCQIGTKVDENTGTMTLFNVERKDAGDYSCIAENNAGRLEASAHLSVIIKPKVQQLENVTSWVGKEVTALTCQASGDPLPKIIWRKWSRK